MKYYFIGALAASLAYATAGASANDSNTVTLEPTVNTICLDTRLTYEGAKECKDEMAEAKSSEEKNEVFLRFAARINGGTPLRNSLTSSGAGVKDATPVPSNLRK